MGPKDHTVPQMYLRRFGIVNKGASYIERIPVADFPSNGKRVNVKNVSAVDGFYSFDDGQQSTREVESLLGKLETAAAASFSVILDDYEFALPRKWPLEDRDRLNLSWWMAAQVLRTTRQRSRIAESIGLPLDPPANVKRARRGQNEHIQYIVSQISALAMVLYDRPWAVGFSDACLISSDVPVLVLNGQDHANQLLAASYWDIFLPLDPHRFLLLPGIGSQEEDVGKRRDHYAKLPGGLGLFFLQAVYDAADQIPVRHPNHTQLHDSIHHEGRLPYPDAFRPNTGSQNGYVISYEVMSPNLQIERRWVNEHAPSRRDPE